MICVEGWSGGWGEMFPCPGLRGCLCFLGLPHMVSVVRRNHICSPDKGLLCWVGRERRKEGRLGDIGAWGGTVFRPPRCHFGG